MLVFKLENSSDGLMDTDPPDHMPGFCLSRSQWRLRLCIAKVGPSGRKRGLQWVSATKVTCWVLSEKWGTRPRITPKSPAAFGS